MSSKKLEIVSLRAYLSLSGREDLWRGFLSTQGFQEKLAKPSLSKSTGEALQLNGIFIFRKGSELHPCPFPH